MSTIEIFASLIECDVYNYMLENDNEFRTFVDKNKNKTTESIAADYNIDMSMLNKLI